MAIANQIGNILDITGIGDDAFKNLFSVSFPSLPERVKSLQNSLGIDLAKEQIRISAFNIPQNVLGTSEVKIRGIKVSKLNGTINEENDLTFEIRVDRNWNYYKLFYEWKKLYGNNKKGTREIRDNSKKQKGQIRINTFSSQEGISWLFHDVILFGLGEVSFDASMGDPVAVNLQFKFSYYEVE